MKTLSLILALTALTNIAQARNKNVLSCATEDGADQVQILQKPDGTLQARVTTESTGGGYPSFVYKVSRAATPPGLVGAPLRYTGAGFDLSVVVDGGPQPGGLPATLNVPAIGIDEAVRCTFQ